MKNMKEKYVTIVGMANYYGIEVFDIGQIVWLRKDRENIYDEDAIAVYLNQTMKIGYVANSVTTVARGTKSAGRIYDRLKNKTMAKVMFVVRGCVIAKIID